MATKKIMIAEDCADTRRALGKLLQGRGYEVVLADDGYQGVEVAVRERPDLLLLDVHMPAGDGFSVHERILHHNDLELIPVIYMTSDPSFSVEQDAERDGAVALLHKPVDPDDLLRIVQETIGPAAQAA